MTKRVELCTKLFERRIYALLATTSEYSEVILIAVTKSREVRRKGCSFDGTNYPQRSYVADTRGYSKKNAKRDKSSRSDIEIFPLSTKQNHYILIQRYVRYDDM